MSEKKSVHTLEMKGHILRVEPIVSPISMLEMFPESLMLIRLTVLILFLLKDFSNEMNFTINSHNSNKQSFS